MTSASALEQSSSLSPLHAAAGQSLWSYARSSGLRALVLGASKDPNAKITVLLISPESGRPVLAVKAPTTDASARAVEAEVSVLRELDRCRLGPLVATIPRVVDLVEFDGRTAAVMTAVPGIPLTTSYLQWRHTRSATRVAADFATVRTWIAAFQCATAAESAQVEMDNGVSDRLRRRFFEVKGLDGDLERLTRIYERLRREEVPRTTVHGDFWFGNILQDGGRVTGAVDWEASSLAGEPVRDLVRFALMYALYLDRRTRAGRPVAGHPGLLARNWGAGVAYAIRGNGWFPELFRGFLQDGLARLGASPERWVDAALAGIAEVAAFTDDEAFGRAHLLLFRSLRGPERLRAT